MQDDGTYWTGVYNTASLWQLHPYRMAITLNEKATISFLGNYTGDVYYDETTIFVTFKNFREVFKFKITANEGGPLIVKNVVLDAEHSCINERNVS